MKNILMIATGGTIASKEGDLGLTPAVTGEELAASVPGIKDICHLEILQLMNIDSTNMRPRQWLMIRDAIMENYNHYDALSSCMEQTPWHTPPLPCLISFRTV